MAYRTPLVEYIIAYQDALIQTDFIREIFMISDRLSVTNFLAESTITAEVSTQSPLYRGKLVVHDNHYYGIITYTRTDDHSNTQPTYTVTLDDTHIPYDFNNNVALATPQDVFVLQTGDIANYTGDPVDTTIGRFITNAILLVYPFGDKIPYLNQEIKINTLEKPISDLMLSQQTDVNTVKDKYINTLTLHGTSNDIICPNISEKTITIPQSIHDLRDKLVRDNRQALEEGDAAVMSDIEKQLISAYRAYLGDDTSTHYLLKGKYYNVTLKKLFLTQGMTEVFGSPGKFTFVDNPMGSGWKVKDLPVIFNEVRQGSYARAIETAQGGVIAKLILRVFQDSRIYTPDCGTTRGEHVHGTKEVLKDFLWNYVITPNGDNEVITEQSLPSYIGKDLVIRTPGYCQASQGYCAKCFGHLFETLEQQAFAPIANAVGTAFQTASLKKMHGTTHSTSDISNLDRYLT